MSQSFLSKLSSRAAFAYTLDTSTAFRRFYTVVLQAVLHSFLQDGYGFSRFAFFFSDTPLHHNARNPLGSPSRGVHTIS